MKKVLTLIATFAFAIALMAPRAEAQASFIPYIGFDLDQQSMLVGVGADFNFLPDAPIGLAIRPSAEYYFSGAASDDSAVQLNGDIIADIAAGGTGFNLFAGGGLAYRIQDTPVVGDEDHGGLGFNILGGAEFGTGFLVPFAQGRITIGDFGSTTTILGGVRLQL